jgi:hypothetical protein
MWPGRVHGPDTKGRESRLSDLRAPAISGNLFLMENPSDVPKPEPLGDRDENVLYAAVGRALSQWETVETASLGRRGGQTFRRKGAHHWTVG